MAGDDAGFEDRGAGRIADDALDVDAPVAQGGEELVSVGVLARHRHQLDDPTQFDDIGGHVARAPRHGMLFLDIHHGDRRLGRKPMDGPADKAVHHEVPHHEDGGAGEFG